MIELVVLPLPETIPDNLFLALLDRISPLKKHRISTRRYGADKMRGLFSELLLRKLLSRRLRIENEAIRFEYNYYGKPFLANDGNSFLGNIHFSVSHSGIWTVAAIDEFPIGVDIEKISPVDISLVRNYFSPEEYTDVMNAQDQPEYFYTLWTLKESYIKLLGKGLEQPLNSFSIRVSDQGNFILNKGRNNVFRPYFRPYKIHGDYQLGLCAVHSHMPVSAAVLDIEEIIGGFLGAGSRQKEAHV